MQNLVESFLASEARYSGRPAVIVERPEGAEQYTYADIRRLAGVAAAMLRTRGLARGERCAILAENHARWCAAFLGILAQGGVAVPLDTTLNTEQVAILLRDSGARVIFTSQTFLPIARQAAESCPNLRHTLMLEDLALPQSGPVNLTPGPTRCDDLAGIFYSSGTTGDPKGVELTHGNLLAEFDAVLQVIDVGPDDRILGILPLFHVLALLANFWLAFAVGASVIYLSTISATEILRAMRERRITAFCVVPQFFYLIHQRIFDQVRAGGLLRRVAFRLLLGANALARAFGLNCGRIFFRPVHSAIGPQMRLWVTGGSRFDPRVARDLHCLGLILLNAYGLTECSGAATVTPAKDNRIGSVGKPLSGVEIKIVPADLPDTDHAHPSGEIALRGPIVMRGYWNRADATAETIQDGWLLTGDLGYLDSGGHLFITGRKKDVIVLSSGKNIYPEEIEAHYIQSPYIKEICVLGRAQPSEPLAERLHAVVVPDFDVLRERKMVNAREILRYEIESFSLQLPSHKRILSYDIWPQELPRTTTRKIKRFEVEKMLAARAQEAAAEAPAKRELTDADRAWLAEPRIARALARVRRAAPAKRDDLHPDSNLELDLGLDSMQRVELLVNLEQEFNVQLEEETAHRIYTVRELVNALLAPPAPAAAAAPTAGAPAPAPQPTRPAPGPASAQTAPTWDAILANVPEDDAAFVHILKPKRLLAPLLFGVSRLGSLLARVPFPLRVEGREHLPREQAYILCPNHQSYLDVFLLVSALPYHSFRRLFFLGASEYFATPLRRLFARWLNVIPVDPDVNLARAMQAGAYGLRHGKVLVLFPEGERTIDGEVKTFKKGAAILSAHLRVPIVPVALDGIFDVWPRGRPPQKLAPIRIRMGAPLAPPALPAHAPAEELERLYACLTNTLRDAVVEMFQSVRRLRRAA